MTAEALKALLARVTRAAIDRPFRFLGAALVVFAASVLLASHLEIRSSFEELLPSDVPSVAHIQELVKRVGGDGTVLVLIESKTGPENLGWAKQLGAELVKEYLALGPRTIRSIEWNNKPVGSYFADHWPMFASVADLEKARDVIKDEVSKAKKKANPLLKLGDLDDEDSAPESPPSKSSSVTSAWLDPAHKLPKEEIEARFKERDPDGYYVTTDHRGVTLVVRPTGTSLGVGESRALLDEMQRIALRHQSFLDEHELRVGFGGTFPMFVAEYEAVLHDVASTAALCLSLVLGSLFLFYRDLRSTVALGLAIVAAVATTFGLTRLVIGYLNTQTAFLGSIVVGNGINYGLIYLARVKQLRRSGSSLQSSCVEGALTAAQGTLLASTATSVSFGTLIIAANRGFRHFGFIGGIGMLLCWVFTFLLVPALLSVFEKIRPVRPTPQAPVALRSAPPLLTRLFARPSAIIAVFAALQVTAVVLFMRQIPHAIEHNLENLSNELKGEDELIRDNNRAQGSLGKSIAGAIALLPSREIADEFCEVVRARQASSARYAKVIQGCDTVSSVVPREQDRKLAIIHDITSRLSDLVLDELPKSKSARLREVKAQLEAQRPLQVEDAPPTLIDRFRERDGTVGRLAAVTARGDALLELAPNLAAFVEAVRNVPVQGKEYDASGENVIFADLLANIEREGPLTTVISLVGVCALVALFFRRTSSSLQVIGALIAGVILMGGVAAALELKINFFNFIVFPITFGVAVDYGANLVVRMRERGDVLASLAEVGPAVALCSWTSIIGYGSLLFALNRALRSFGWYAMIGEVTSICTALLLLPAMSMLWAKASRPEENEQPGIVEIASKRSES
jgi:predicted RND superfamily exporter protein